MVGRLDRCFLLSLRTPAEAVVHLVPRGLSLVTHGPWAFWNLVVSHITGMRPRPVPSFLGLDYHHVAYRLLVRGMSSHGPVEGLFFLRSDVDASSICLPGNRLSDFRFHASSVRVQDAAGSTTIQVRSAKQVADLDLSLGPGNGPTRASDSCFPDATEAHAFLKYQPLGLCPDPGAARLRIARVHRNDSLWREQPVHVRHWSSTFFETLGVPTPSLELATCVEPLDYAWTLGERVPLTS